MSKVICLVMVACVFLTGCATIKSMFNFDKEKTQAKIIAAAKEAVIKIAYKKIDEKNIDETMKAVMKEVAKNLIDKTFARLEAEYNKLSQDEIEKDGEAIVTQEIEGMTTVLQAAAQKN